MLGRFRHDVIWWHRARLKLGSDHAGSISPSTRYSRQYCGLSNAPTWYCQAIKIFKKLTVIIWAYKVRTRRLHFSRFFFSISACSVEHARKCPFFAGKLHPYIAKHRGAPPQRSRSPASSWTSSRPSLQLHGTLTSTSRTFAISLDSLPVHLDQLKHCCSQFNLYCFCPLFQAGNERHGLNLKVLGLERVFLPLLRRLWPSMAHKGGAIFGWALSCIFNISVSLHEPSLLFQWASF